MKLVTGLLLMALSSTAFANEKFMCHMVVIDPEMNVKILDEQVVSRVSGRDGNFEEIRIKAYDNSDDHIYVSPIVDANEKNTDVYYVSMFMNRETLSGAKGLINKSHGFQYSNMPDDTKKHIVVEVRDCKTIKL